MGQQDVIEILVKMRGRELTSPELAELIDLNVRSVRRCLNSIAKDSNFNLKFRILDFNEKKEKFGNVVNTLVRVYWLE